jgi:hypothetical protein
VTSDQSALRTAKPIGSGIEPLPSAFGDTAPVRHLGKGAAKLRLMCVEHGPRNGALTEPLEQQRGCPIHIIPAQDGVLPNAVALALALPVGDFAAGFSQPAGRAKD